jgi:hypothetical protein
MSVAEDDFNAGIAKCPSFDDALKPAFLFYKHLHPCPADAPAWPDTIALLDIPGNSTDTVLLGQREA